MQDAEERLRRSVLAALPEPAELRTLALSPQPEDRPAAGTRPSAVLRDRAGRRFFFKQAQRAHIAAEEIAGSLRALGRRPLVPAVGRRLELPGLGEVEGLLQPWVEPSAGGLGHDTSTWSALQRESMLREHPWEWVLANLDTHDDQYLLLGPDHLPVNIDWDHSLADLDTTDLTRFTARKATIVPLRNKLYVDYVHGRVDLSFRGLFEQVRRIREVPPEHVAELVRRYGRTCELADDRAGELVDRVLERQLRLASDFAELVRGLEHERSLERRNLRRALPAEVGTRLRETWQRFVLDVLHPVVMRRLYAAYRWVLSLWTRRRTAGEG